MTGDAKEPTTTTFAELLAGFTPEQIARMEEFADNAPERTPEQQRLLERVFAGAGERLLTRQHSHQTAA